MILTGDRFLAVLAFVLAYSMGVMGMCAVQSSFMVELFGSRSRLAAVSSSKELGELTSGGVAPVICGSLVALSGNLWAVTGYMALLAIVSIISCEVLPETRGYDLLTSQDAR